MHCEWGVANEAEVRLVYPIVEGGEAVGESLGHAGLLVVGSPGFVSRGGHGVVVV